MKLKTRQIPVYQITSDGIKQVETAVQTYIVERTSRRVLKVLRAKIPTLLWFTLTILMASIIPEAPFFHVFTELISGILFLLFAQAFYDEFKNDFDETPPGPAAGNKRG